MNLRPREWDPTYDAEPPSLDHHSRRVPDVGYDAVSGEMVPPERAVELDDAPHPNGSDRYAIYVVSPGFQPAPGMEAAPNKNRRVVAEAPRDGLGLALTTLREEGQITNDSRVGILDRETRTWIVNPWGRGDV